MTRRLIYCLVAGQLALAADNYAALGDSYSSGPSAGDAWDKSPCLRTKMSHPAQVYDSGDLDADDFTFISCAGAKTHHIWEVAQGSAIGDGGMADKPQVDVLEGLNPNVISLSIGGNDAGFAETLMSCVYRSWGGCSCENDYDCSGECEKAMQKLDRTVNDAQLSRNLTKAYDAIFQKAPNTQLFVTNYPRFWNADTDQCDKISFTTWCPFKTPVPVIKARRRRMNELTYLLNSKIEDAVNNYNIEGDGSITYVDVDTEFEGHRFCEENVKEPSYRNSDIWFYPLEFRTGGTLVWDNATIYNGQNCSELTDGDTQGDYFTCQLAKGFRDHGDEMESDLSKWPNNVDGDDDLGTLDDLVHVPGWASRVFHPTKKGHAAYKKAILSAYNHDAVLADGAMLKVLPIGDSITFGAKSTDDNGYRKLLRSLLAARGNVVDFVGSLDDGSFEDNQHEGHRGEVIDDIVDDSSKGIHAGLNIVLVHAGTNDMKKDLDVGNAPKRLKNMIDKILSYSPKAAIFVAQIIPSSTAAYQTRIEAFNEAIPSLVKDYVSDGKKVTMVQMNEAVSVSDLSDNLHPKDQGYTKMANAWYKAIIEADKKGWIVAASAPTEGGNCNALPTWATPITMADGSKEAYSDGDFSPAWNKIGTIAEATDLGNQCVGTYLRFMDIDGDGAKDIACVDKENSDVWVQRTILDDDGNVSGKWRYTGKVSSGLDKKGSGVLFADLNGDGKDDFIYVNENGDVDAWINKGSSDDGWSWKSIGQIASGVGATDENVQLPDIDGDGRADFAIVGDSGAVTGWLNVGTGDKPDYHKIGIIASGKTASADDKVILGDFTGEGRADYMVVGETGKVNGFVNRLNGVTDVIPRWLSAMTLAEGPDGAKRSQVHMVDMNGNGKVDYVLEKSAHTVQLWENKGSNGKYQPGEGVFICDLDGDGTNDYFWVDQDGKGWGYLNVGKGTNGWKALGNTAVPQAKHNRKDIRMAVLTHTKRADYVVIDEDTGRAEWWQNLGEDGDWGWSSRGELASGPKNTIESTFGWEFYAANIRFADLTGDGYDDFLYINEDGSVVMWRRDGGSSTDPGTWGPATLVADKQDPVSPEEVRFADINGDGRFDYLTVSRFTGAVTMRRNLRTLEGGAIQWEAPVQIADGTGPGRTIQLADMTGDGRADYMRIDPDDASIQLWRNRCVE
ncbi:hypothetical protein G7046_g1583 [Stylonectria norvegica]|nr:hypothetical protein G7046_g1583 [Stylonectria norvegica]